MISISVALKDILLFAIEAEHKNRKKGVRDIYHLPSSQIYSSRMKKMSARLTFSNPSTSNHLALQNTTQNRVIVVCC